MQDKPAEVPLSVLRKVVHPDLEDALAGQSPAGAPLPYPHHNRRRVLESRSLQLKRTGKFVCRKNLNSALFVSSTLQSEAWGRFLPLLWGEVSPEVLGAPLYPETYA